LPLLDWRSDGALAAYHDRYLAPSGATLSAVDLSDVHGIPVVLAVVRGNPGALVVGACASCDVRTAWLGAVTEAYAVRKAARETVLAEPVNPFVPPFAGIRDFQDHVRVYAYAENADRAAFLDASPVSRQPHEVPRVPGGDALARVDALVARLASHGIDTYAVDVTAPDVRELGVHVMRVVAPRLLPLDVRHDARFLGGKRLYTEPERLGYASRRLTFADLNPDPHPFP
jgi:ribosomal protein S12 methylthiotransferase accessory factor